tara:strand:- start:3740 stop:4117 length:378 start_codon:yes stop_codon:yes gene_type:complete
MDQGFFPWPWELNDWKKLEHSSSKYLVVWSEGFGLALWQLDNFPNAYLLKILTLPNVLKCGIGSSLMKLSLEALRSLNFANASLEVQTDNDPAISLYRKFSWQESRVIKGFYSGGGDALSMNLQL